MGIFSWLQRKPSSRTDGYELAVLDDFRRHIHRQAQSAEERLSSLTSRDAVVAIYVAELIQIGREKVCILGDLLPAEVFLSAPVRAAMDGFFSRNPTAQIVVATNDPAYTREALIADDDYLLDVSRVKIMPLSRITYPPGKSLRFVLSDSKSAPSYWFNDLGAASWNWGRNYCVP